MCVRTYKIRHNYITVCQLFLNSINKYLKRYTKNAVNISQHALPGICRIYQPLPAILFVFFIVTHLTMCSIVSPGEVT